MSNLRFFLALPILLFLCGFKPKVRHNGYVDFGTHVQAGLNKEQVFSMMGKPSVISELTNNWYYINVLTSRTMLGFNKYYNADVIALTFKEDKVAGINHHVVSKRRVPNINRDSILVRKDTLEMKIVRIFKGLAPSL